MNYQSNSFRMNPPNIWTQVGPNNVPIQSNGSKRGIGRLNTIAFHPSDPDIIYVGAPAGGFAGAPAGGLAPAPGSADGGPAGAPGAFKEL